MTCFSDWSPLVVVVVEDDEALVGVLCSQVTNTVWDGVQVNKFAGDVFEGRASFLDDLFDLDFNWGMRR